MKDTPQALPDNTQQGYYVGWCYGGATREPRNPPPMPARFPCVAAVLACDREGLVAAYPPDQSEAFRHLL